MRDHFFCSDIDGALHDTRVANWTHHILRHHYCRTFERIETVAQFKATLRAGAHTDIGGYPLYLICADGESLSFESARENAREIMTAIGERRIGDSWRVTGCAINYEDAEMRCAHSGKLIPSAYGTDEESADASEVE